MVSEIDIDQPISDLQKDLDSIFRLLTLRAKSSCLVGEFSEAATFLNEEIGRYFPLVEFGCSIDALYNAYEEVKNNAKEYGQEEAVPV